MADVATLAPGERDIYKIVSVIRQQSSLLASSGLAGGSLPGTSVDNTVPRFDGIIGNLQGSGVTIDDSDNVIIPGTLTINPTALSLDRGLSITQSVVGVASAFQALNRILITSDTATISGGGQGIVVGLDIAHLFGGADTGARTALNIEARRIAAADPATANYQDVGLGFAFNSSVNNNGTGIAPRGNGFAGFSSAHLSSGATFWDGLNSFQFGLGVSAGASASIQIGVRIGHNPFHAVKGSTYDVALDFVDDATTVVGWDSLITSSNVGGKYPLAATGTFIQTLGAQTFANGIDMSSATITADFLKGPNGFQVAGTGNIVTLSAVANQFIGSAGQAAPLILQGATGTHTSPQLDTTSASKQAMWQYLDQGSLIWAVGKETSNSFAIFDNVLSKYPLTIVSNTGVVTFGVPATNSGLLDIAGSTSGTISLKPQAAAGTYNWNWPTGPGTPGQALLSGGGAATAMSFGTLGVGGGGTGTTTAFTAGSVVFAGASGVYSQDNAQLFWDNTNNRLGIGTATPSQQLEIVGGTTQARLICANAGFGALSFADATGVLGSFQQIGTDAPTWGARAGAMEFFQIGATGYIEFFTNATAAVRISQARGLSVNTAVDAGAGMIRTNAATFMIRTSTSYTNGAGAGAGTITNAPAAGNPTKWIPVDDNGTTRHVPAW